jgi:DNA-directed RNA polymerase subunit RPC12/RpoP
MRSSSQPAAGSSTSRCTMGDPRRWLRCVRCNKDYDFEQVRYLPDRSGVACKTCLGIVDREHAELRKREGKLLNFQCVGCRYMFSRSAAHQPENCPQCGKRDIIKFEKEKLSANTLLKLADDPRLDHLEH